MDCNVSAAAVFSGIVVGGEDFPVEVADVLVVSFVCWESCEPAFTGVCPDKSTDADEPVWGWFSQFDLL